MPDSSSHKAKLFTAIIVIVIVVMALAIGYLFWTLHSLGAGMVPTTNTAPSGQSTPQDTQGVVIGNNPVGFIGSVASVHGNSIDVVTDNGTTTVNVTPATVMYSQGASKSDTELQKEMSEYNQEVNTLMQDPQKNKAALKALVLPTPFIQIPLMLSDFKAGEQVGVTPGDKNSNGSYNALKIVLLNK